MFDSGHYAAPAILILTIVISLLGMYQIPDIINKFLFRPYYFLREKQYDTMIMSGFIHADPTHLLFNMITFYLLRLSAGAFSWHREVRRLVRRWTRRQPYLHLVQGAQQPAVRFAGCFRRYLGCAVRLHRLFPVDNAAGLLHTNARHGVRLSLRRLFVVGIEKRQRPHQSRCTSLRCP